MRPAWLGLIAVGGGLGTALRAWLEGSFATPPGQWPWVTFWINLGGAFLLGVLLESLAETGADRGWRRGVRLGVGTGLLGGFTTYSTFSVEIVERLRAGAWAIGVGYGLASVVGGLGAAWLALWVTRRLLRPWRAGRAR